LSGREKLHFPDSCKTPQTPVFPGFFKEIVLSEFTTILHKNSGFGGKLVVRQW